jgi:hypothetical protein
MDKAQNVNHRMPADFDRNDGRGWIQESWYEARLGLLDPASDTSEAIQFYLDVFLDRRKGMWPYVGTLKEKWGKWSPTKIYHGMTTKGSESAPEDRYRAQLSRRRLLALLWRGNVAAVAPSQTDLKGLFGSSQHSILSAIKKIGASKLTPLYRPADGDGITPNRVRMPFSERWLKLYTGTGLLRWFIVDLDFHKETDRPIYEAAIKFFTRCPGLPKPGLIVTSWRGLHLYYFFEKQTVIWPSHHPYEKVTRWVAAFTAGVQARFGIPLGGSGVEVFPKLSDGRPFGARMPSLPFGPYSQICDSLGFPIAPCGVASVVAWQKQCGGEVPRLPPIEDWTWNQPGPVLKSVTAPLRDLVLAPDTPKVTKAGNGPGSMTQCQLANNVPDQVEPNNLSDVLRLLRDFPEPGETNTSLPLIARLLKHNIGMPEAEGKRYIMDWLRPLITKKGEHSYAHYASRVDAFWDRSLAPLLAEKALVYAVTSDDYHEVAKRVMDWKPALGLNPTARFMLGCIGIARHYYDRDSGQVPWVSIYSRTMKSWYDDYAKLVLYLSGKGFLSATVAHRRPELGDKGTRTTRLYTVDLPAPSADLRKFDSLDEVWDDFLSEMNVGEGSSPWLKPRKRQGA